jgi:hypothetical protein
MLQIVFLVSLESTGRGGVHGAGKDLDEQDLMEFIW